MDNNMINIDDLFRQRMGNAEEEQRPGSWLKMKELLDEQMPVAPPVAGTNWRRMLYVTAGVLLISTITVGSYQAYQAFRGNNISDNVLAKYTAQRSGGTTGAVATVMNYADGKTIAAPNSQQNAITADNNNVQNTNAISAGNSNNVNTTNTNNNANQHIVSDNTPSTQGTNGNNSTNTNNTNNTSNSLNNSSIATTTSSSASNDNIVSDRNNGNKNAVAQNNNDQQVSGNKLDAQMASVTENIQNIFNSGANNSGRNVATNNTQQQGGATNNASNSTDQNSGSENNIFALNSDNNKPNNGNVGNNINPVQPKNNAQDAIVNNVDNTQQVDQFKIDSIKKIEMRQRVAADGKMVMDTFGIGSVPIRKKVDNEINDQDLLAANNAKTDAAKDNVIIPNATDLQMTTEDGKGVFKPLVPNSAAKDSKDKKKYYDNNRFDEMVKNAKLKLRGVKFYPGVVAGANMSMSQKGLSGFQLGLKGDLSLGNHWTVFSEVKYMQRFNGGKDLRDDYNTGLDSFVAQSGVKVYTYDSVEHFFNFTNISTIEMPIALKYNIKRFNVFGGVNLNYNLAVNNDEVERPYQITKTETSLSTGQLNYDLLSGKPNISSADFSSRFSVGYLFGMSYELTPSMQIDLRLTQSVWDNAKTSGAKAVSKELYNAPNLQFNMSYRFGQKPYKKFRK